jgi:hypothetical protein
LLELVGPVMIQVIHNLTLIFEFGLSRCCLNEFSRNNG